MVQLDIDGLLAVVEGIVWIVILLPFVISILWGVFNYLFNL